MCKFKLIKEYPNSPELGFITDETMHFPASYPEFWEKVKEWEVIQEYYGLLTMNYQCIPSKHIVSVKRLSDNTVFSIGDKVINPKLKSNATFTITKFELDFEGEHMLALGGNGAIGIHKIEKYKKPLFITEDGVEVFERDLVHWVNNSTTGGYKYLYAIQFHKAHLQLDFKDTFKIFSTKQTAEEWINKNKKILTTEDGVDLFQGDEFWHVDPWFNAGKGSLKDTKPSFFPLDGYHNFSTEQAAKDWIEMNKPQFSKSDLIKAMQAVGNINVNQVIYELKK